MSAKPDLSFFGIYEDLILTRNGTWLSNGEEITHKKTILVFSSHLYRCKDGYEIRLGTEKKSVHVEDTIYFVTGLEGDSVLGYTLHLNDGRTTELNPETLKYKSGRLTVKVPHPNEGTEEEAKFLTQTYYELLNHIENTEDGFSITLSGKKILFHED